MFLYCLRPHYIYIYTACRPFYIPFTYEKFLACALAGHLKNATNGKNLKYERILVSRRFIFSNTYSIRCKQINSKYDAPVYVKHENAHVTAEFDKNKGR